VIKKHSLTLFLYFKKLKNKIMIRLNVFISVEEANHTKVLDAAIELTTSSVKEEGCIAYDVFKSATRPNVLLICETWKDSKAISLHEKGTSFIQNIAILKEFASIKVEKFEF
jgi:quinol monooxygenase YgiN